MYRFEIETKWCSVKGKTTYLYREEALFEAEYLVDKLIKDACPPGAYVSCYSINKEPEIIIKKERS